MAIKLTVQGMLIYAAMLAYLLAAATIKGADRRRGALHLAGFVAIAAAVVLRWGEVRHVPMRNLYEVFCVLGAFSWPVAVFGRRVLGVAGERADALIGVILLFPAGFVFSAEPQPLPAVLQSWLFAPHVASYLLAYMILVKAAVQAGGCLAGWPTPDFRGAVGYEVATYRLVRLGFPLLTLGLILGAVWGKRAWGDWWNWDPKELWSLATWLMFVFYFHFRALYGARKPRANAAIVLAGAAAIVITLLWVNLSRIFAGLHSYAV